MANKKGSGWTTGEDEILVKTMNEAINRPAGYRKSARLLGRTPSACTNRYAKERYKVVTESIGKSTSAGFNSKDLPNPKALAEPTIIVQKPRNGKIIEEIQENLKDLENNLTERISELYEVKGRQADRHSFIYYRKYVSKLQRLANKIK